MRLLQALLPALLTLGALCPGAAASGALTSLVATSPAPAGKVFMDRDEALELAFPGCAVKRTTVYLDREQVKLIEQRSRVSFEGSMLYPYRAMRDGKLVGTAYFDTHRVRSKRETLMVVVGADGAVGRVEVLAFGEPVDYIPRDRWYGQFDGRSLDADLSLGRKIRGVTGATPSCPPRGRDRRAPRPPATRAGRPDAGRGPRRTSPPRAVGSSCGAPRGRRVPSCDALRALARRP